MYVAPKEMNEYPWYVRAFFWKQKHTYGEVLKPGMLWAGLRWFSQHWPCSMGPEPAILAHRRPTSITGDGPGVADQPLRILRRYQRVHADEAWCFVGQSRGCQHLAVERCLHRKGTRSARLCRSHHLF
jgi:hypothetical protein